MECLWASNTECICALHMHNVTTEQIYHISNACYKRTNEAQPSLHYISIARPQLCKDNSNFYWSKAYKQNKAAD